MSLARLAYADSAKSSAAARRWEALKNFLVNEGIGKYARSWKLAQSLSALYPPGIDETHWVDGVLTRKKGFGF